MNTSSRLLGPPRNTRFKPALDKKLRAYAKLHQRTLSSVVRMAVEAFFKEVPRG